MLLGRGNEMAKLVTTKNTTHVTTGCIFEDLGFSPEEAAVLRLKATLHSELLKVIKKNKLTQKQVSKILDIQQPQISKLLKGDLERITADRLTRYLRFLGQEVKVTTKKAPKLHGTEVA